MKLLFLTGLVKSFLYKGMRKKRELLAFSHNLVCHQELCSETVGCRGPHTTPDQERTIIGSSRTQLCPQRHCIPWEQNCSLCLVFFSLFAFSAGSLYRSNQDHKKKKTSWHFTPVQIYHRPTNWTRLLSVKHRSPKYITLTSVCIQELLQIYLPVSSACNDDSLITLMKHKRALSLHEQLGKCS